MTRRDIEMRVIGYLNEIANSLRFYVAVRLSRAPYLTSANYLIYINYLISKTNYLYYESQSNGNHSGAHRNQSQFKKVRFSNRFYRELNLEPWNLHSLHIASSPRLSNLSVVVNKRRVCCMYEHLCYWLNTKYVINPRY